MAALHYSRLGFHDLEGWADDDHQAALDVYEISLPSLDECWPHPADQQPREFFEVHFVPVCIADQSPPLFTGYFEPEYEGTLTPDVSHRFPAYAVPPDLTPNVPYASRVEIERDGRLIGAGLELAWFADPLDLYFLQVQGSGRVRLPDGGMIRLGFAAKNGHPYTSLGKSMIAAGHLTARNVSPEAIRHWIAKNPDAGRDLMWENASYVFFRRIDDVDPEKGPLGAMGYSIMPNRSIAVDPDITPLGAPVWIEKAGARPMHRLMVAQDTGSAIKGAGRADIFFGTGVDAGLRAGRVMDTGRMVVLLPHALADALMERDNA